jgi:hypothetical protein
MTTKTADEVLFTRVVTGDCKATKDGNQCILDAVHRSFGSSHMVNIEGQLTFWNDQEKQDVGS